MWTLREWPETAIQTAAQEKPKPATVGNERFSLKARGFVEATATLRTRNQNADVGETFGNVPLDGTANSALSSFRMSKRYSRLSLLAKAQADRLTATG